jgi:hypothetical protein
MPEPKIPADLLGQHWVHSHEEDTATEMVFRPATHQFPRSRGRQALQLGADGTLVEGGPGPSDRPERSPGRWRLTEDGGLALYRGSASTPYRVLRIVSLSKDRLVLRKAP